MVAKHYRVGCGIMAEWLLKTRWKAPSTTLRHSLTGTASIPPISEMMLAEKSSMQPGKCGSPRSRTYSAWSRLLQMSDQQARVAEVPSTWHRPR